MTGRTLAFLLSGAALFVLATYMERASAAVDPKEEASMAAGQLEAGPYAYKDGDVELEGYLAYNPIQKGKRPGILIVHEWWGVNEYTQHRAQRLARMGCVALVADMYGKGLRATTAEAAAKLAGPFRADRDLMRQRVGVALANLKANPRVDTNRIVAIGYCFGGTCVLELARSGADLAGVVSFHGGVDAPHPDATQKPRAAILVCHGAADPNVPAESVDAFRREMNRCGADWQLNMYGGAVHSFTNPDAGNDPSKGFAYQAAADRRSWEDMLQFFSRVLGNANDAAGLTIKASDK